MSLKSNIASYLAQYRDWDSEDDLARGIHAMIVAHMTSGEAVKRAWWAHMRCEDGTAMDMFRAAILAALGEGE